MAESTPWLFLLGFFVTVILMTGLLLNPSARPSLDVWLRSTVPVAFGLVFWLAKTCDPQEEHVKTFEEYEGVALQTALYPNKGSNLVYPTLGLAGESGEFAEKVKKVLRDRDGDFSDPAVKQAMIKELGDVLWYVTACSRELGVTLEDVAEANARKLLSRKDRNKIHGDGDNR